MDAAKVDRFVNIPYCPRHMDCADLTLLVQREIFGREVELPGKRPRPLDDAAQGKALRVNSRQLAQRIDAPADGDLVLMLDFGQAEPGHAGTYLFIAHEPWVLHTSHKLGGSRLHRVRDLPGMGLRIEGYYRWI